MNIDIQPMNKGTLHTKYYVPLPKEVLRQLAMVIVFFDLDMGNKFHQIQMVKESQILFQT